MNSVNSNLLFIAIFFFLFGIELFTNEEGKINWILASCVCLLGFIGGCLGAML